ncbi:flagellar filament capping protein FliD [Neorhodopirellula pilleata]|uniref:Flagellar hook-associated protein 2 n=1 Tax=Neorhodopirellula pilleata TaxID=2714738 RepID=A0A5C6ARP7_9BACT|nr:flagellar filament capping protein FliD [Neorhodopirellula pilleata]TWU01929.1 Flagellar hook-associated protein 2 [Neorhodopirellula pilleata]
MGRLQSSIGLVTGTDIVGTVDQLMAISAQPRDRLLRKAQEIQGQQQQVASLTATVIGVQLAGNGIGVPGLFRSKAATSSNEAAVSVKTGDAPINGEHLIRTLQTAATHNVQSAQRFDTSDEALNLTGKITIQPSGFVDQKVQLSGLNDGLGVQPGKIRLTDRSGQSAEVDLTSARTIDDVLQAINDADVGISATTKNGKIRLIDQTGATDSNLKVEQLGSAETAADLGLWGIDEASSTVDGKAIDLPEGTNSLRGASLSQLGGGAGLTGLTEFDITLSDGSEATIDVSDTSSLGEVIDAINNSGLELIARINDAGNGIRLRDVSGGEGSFVISSDDETAAKLGIAGTAESDIIDGADLNLQTVTLETELASLNQGRGVGTGSFTIRDSSGATGAINIVADEIETIGDLVDKINGLSIDVTASLNEAGDGIQIEDTAGGVLELKITDTGTGKVAENLGLAGTAATSTATGSEAITIDITADDTLDSIVEKINTSGRYADASVLANDDGTFSLQIRSNKAGQAGRIGVNTEGLDLTLRTVSQAQDAVISLSTDGGTARFLSSSDGVFEDSVTGLNLTVKELSDEPVNISVEDDPDRIVTAIKRFADQYNKLQDKINEVTAFDADTNEVGLLFGSTETLRMQNGYGRLLTSRIRGSSFQSLAQVGVRLDETGKLKVDETKLKAALAEDLEGVEQFFNRKDPTTDKNIGMVGQLSDLADRYAGTNNGMLINKTLTLNNQLDRNGERVSAMNLRLAAQRERLLQNYYAMEEAIGKIQSNSSYASGISYIGFE